jgi:hypothetical protein
MTVEEAFKLLVDMDEQIIDPRPTIFADLLELMIVLAEHAEPHLRTGPGPDIYGDCWSVDTMLIKRKCYQLGSRKK